MQVTNEGYVFSGNIVKVDIKRNKFFKFIKTHKISIFVSIVFSNLVIAEGILLKMFVKLLYVL